MIKRDFSAFYPEHKWYLDVAEFKLNSHKTYLSPIIDSCTQEVIVCTISHRPNLKQTMDMLRQAWLKNHGINQSRSRKGSSLDDGLMGGYFSILKREMFYSFEKEFKNLSELEETIKKYIKVL